MKQVSNLLFAAFLSQQGSELAMRKHLLHTCKSQIGQLLSLLLKGRATKYKKLDTHNLGGQAIYHSTLASWLSLSPSSPQKYYFCIFSEKHCSEHINCKDNFRWDGSDDHFYTRIPLLQSVLIFGPRHGFLKKEMQYFILTEWLLC